jgi:hypothetical protein
MKSLVRIFCTPTATDLAQRELNEAQRNLLDAQSSKEYAEAMVQYHQTRIARLTSRMCSELATAPVEQPLLETT